MKWIIPLMLLLAVLPSAYADNSVCLNSTHVSETYQFDFSGDQNRLSITNECPYGCSQDFNKCNPAPFKANVVAFGIIFISLALVVWFTTMKSIFGFVGISVISVSLLLLGFIDAFSNPVRLLFALASLGSIIALIQAVKMFRSHDEAQESDEL